MKVRIISRWQLHDDSQQRNEKEIKVNKDCEKVVMSFVMESHLMNNLSPGAQERSYSRDMSYLDSTRSSFSHETSESPSKSSHKDSVFQKIIENQRLSFNLAGELKNLRHDLLQSKQDKRILAGMYHCTIYHIPYTIYHTPYTIYHIPYTIYHTPYTIHHIPYTIHHTPYTIY
ncbi:hypothetical protein EON65_38240, partial [archaeon]